jgi:two-component sensor histidine kinase/CheY-like chemotaxis protein
MSDQGTATRPVVLVVEDEMVLRMRAVDIVEDAGFIPVEAVSADEAITILESRSDISLLLTDIQMPGSMDGLQLAHAVHTRWPAIKIILVSGQVVVSEADKPAQSRYFGKPLEIKQMIAELQHMIGVGALKIFPVAVSDSEPLSRRDALAAEDASLRHLLAQARADKLRLPAQDALMAENDSLRLSLEQAGINANNLLVQAGIEAEEREAAEKLQQLIHGELHHRIKNTIATVGAIASQSLRTASSLEECQHAIEGRLAALGRAHDMLMRVSWANASLSETVRSATEPYDRQGGAVSIEGPDVAIASGAVIALAMTLNELCTNATKFGALSAPGGRVQIAWAVEGERLRMTWTERGGPAVKEPSRRSFGTRMMRSLGQQLNGKVQLAYEHAGFAYTLDVPLAALTAKAARTAAS